MIKKKNISPEDLQAWQDYIKDPTDIEDKDFRVTKNSKNIRYKFDLHGYSLTEANKKVYDMIIFCIKKNYKEILLITGKGIHSNTDKDIFVSKNMSKLKYSVPDYIKNEPELSKFISSVSQADYKDGGEGALIIKLNLKNKF